MACPSRTCSFNSPSASPSGAWFLTRDLAAAKRYVEERYSNYPAATYGLLASSRDKFAAQAGIDVPSVTRFDVARWFNGTRGDARSSTGLRIAASEFACQGLELDFAVVCWGQDLLWREGGWSNAAATRYLKGVRDPMQLRLNAYRVLLTRGRDGFIAYLPPDSRFDETARFLQASGLRPLSEA